MPCFIALLLCLNFSSATLWADTAEDPLAHLRPGHPRLLLTDEGLAATMSAAKTDPLRAALRLNPPALVPLADWH